MSQDNFRVNAINRLVYRGEGGDDLAHTHISCGSRRASGGVRKIGVRRAECGRTAYGGRRAGRKESAESSALDGWCDNGSSQCQETLPTTFSLAHVSCERVQDLPP
jgi:hypothetical protein